jgi:hypothetical protein
LAGLGRKVFNSGDILLASEVQGYLQDQSVMVFEDAAARGSAIPSPTEGMVTFRKDDNALEVYDGAAFNPVGTEPGLVHINETTVSGVQAINFNNVFSADYDNYLVTFDLTSAAGQEITFRMRASGTDASGANYNRQLLQASKTTISGSGAASQTTAQIAAGRSPGITSGFMKIFNPFKAVATSALSETNDPANDVLMLNFAFIHTLTTSYDGFSIITSSNISGTFRVYGLRN